MKNFKNTIVTVLLLLQTALSDAQSWKESTGLNQMYDLSGFSILTIIYEGLNYEEAFDIIGYWKS